MDKYERKVQHLTEKGLVIAKGCWKLKKNRSFQPAHCLSSAIEYSWRWSYQVVHRVNVGMGEGRSGVDFSNFMLGDCLVRKTSSPPIWKKIPTSLPIQAVSWHEHLLKPILPTPVFIPIFSLHTIPSCSTCQPRPQFYTAEESHWIGWKLMFFYFQAYWHTAVVSR